MSQQRLQKWQYTITTISPLHIGTGEEMSPLEYYIGKDLIVPDLDKVFSKYPAAIDRFSQNLARISSGDLAHTSLTSLLDRKILEDSQIWRYSMPAIRNSDIGFDSLAKLKKELARDKGKIRLAIKTPDHLAYIPGTSLKGAFKTAWAYDYCLKTPPLLEAISTQLQQPSRDKVEKAAEQILMAAAFQAPSQARDAAYDIFRVLQLGDSRPRKADDTMILLAERVLNASIYNESPISDARNSVNYKSYWAFCEAIDEHQVFQGDSSIDEGLLNNPNTKIVLGWNESQRALSVESLCKAANQFAADVCKFEVEYFDRLPANNDRYDVEAVADFYNALLDDVGQASANTCFLPLGHAVGWHKLTIGLLLQQKLSAAQFSGVRRATNLAPGHTQFVFPKSRKLVMDGERSACSPLGWIKMEFTQHESR